MKTKKWQNKNKEEKNDKGKDKKISEKRNRAVDDAFAGRKKKTISAKHSRAGKRVYGVRGRARKSEDAERISEESEEYGTTGRYTRYIESSLGIKSYLDNNLFMSQPLSHP